MRTPFLSVLVLGACAAPPPESAVAARLDSLEASRDSLAAEVEDLQARLDAAELALAEAQAEVSECVTDGELDQHLAAYDDVVRVLDTDTTWNVADATELTDTLAELDRYRVASGATVTIQLAAGDYTFPEPLVLHHPDGGRIRIVGDDAAPANVDLHFTGSDGIVIDEGSTLGYLGGLSLHGLASNGSQSGVTVRDGSVATLGPLVVDGFGYDGLYVYGNSWVVGDENARETSGWLTITGTEHNGASVDYGSSAMLPNVQIDGSGSDGVFVWAGSQLYAPGSTVANSGRHGYYVAYTSGLWAESSSSDTSAAGSYVTVYSSFLQASDAIASNDAGGGFYSAYMSMVDAYGATVSNATPAYAQRSNAFLEATGAKGEVDTNVRYNDTEDFILGF